MYIPGQHIANMVFESAEVNSPKNFMTVEIGADESPLGPYDMNLQYRGPGYDSNSRVAKGFSWLGTATGALTVLEAASGNTSEAFASGVVVSGMYEVGAYFKRRAFRHTWVNLGKLSFFGSTKGVDS